MDLDFGHGFIPRIGEGNYKAVDRCVGPADPVGPTEHRDENDHIAAHATAIVPPTTM